MMNQSLRDKIGANAGLILSCLDCNKASPVLRRVHQTALTRMEQHALERTNMEQSEADNENTSREIN
eukprot:8871279-Pyramimonas_sp.AAC.1